VTTAAQLVTRTHRQLLSGVVEERNKLASLVSATATSVVLTYEVGGIREGAVIEIDSEQMYVWGVIESSKTATVERGFNGTTAATHVANSIVTVNPRFPRNQILEAINDEMADLSSPMNGLFQVKTLDITYNPSNRQTDLPAIIDIIDMIEVRYRYKSDDYKKINDVKLIRDLPTKDFGSAMALQIDSNIPASDIRLTYKAPFTKLGSETDDLQINSGYPTTAEDILVIGSQIRMMAPREIKRNFTESQGDTRRSDEVGAGAVSNSITNLLRMRRDRITAEAARLTRKYPTFLQRV
jgi:hypothetical protein